MNSRNKALMITGIAIAAIALVVFLTGGWLAGWDFAAYFASPSFGWLCVLLLLYAGAVAGILIKDRINRL